MGFVECDDAETNILTQMRVKLSKMLILRAISIRRRVLHDSFSPSKNSCKEKLLIEGHFYHICFIK